MKFEQFFLWRNIIRRVLSSNVWKRCWLLTIIGWMKKFEKKYDIYIQSVHCTQHTYSDNQNMVLAHSGPEPEFTSDCSMALLQCWATVSCEMLGWGGDAIVCFLLGCMFKVLFCYTNVSCISCIWVHTRECIIAVIVSLHICYKKKRIKTVL